MMSQTARVVAFPPMRAETLSIASKAVARGEEVMELRALVDDANIMLCSYGEHDWAEAACEKVEHKLIELCRIARAIGVVL
jgi:hypothetical protein